jgi:glycosyltransferase involved in cell wall biosynthesis
MTPTDLRTKLVHIIHLDGPGGGPITMSLHVSYYHQHFDITVLAGGRGVVSDTCKKLGVPFIQLPIDKLWKCFVGFPLLYLQLHRIKPAVVVLHGQWAGPLGSIAARLACRCRILYICQWPSFYTDWDLFRTMRNFIAEKIPCTLADQVIAVAESCGYQYQIRRLAAPPKLVCSTNPIDLTLTPGAAEAEQIRQRHQWFPEHVHVVSVGRLVDQKRVDWLIRAWATVQQETPQARLWIVGDGPEEKSLKSLVAQLGLEASVNFVGARPDAWSYEAASDIVVMTTIYEAQGRVALEAMACGKPIVGNDVDGVRDSFHDGVEGFLVPSADVPALAEALVKLVKSPELRREMGARGLERVKLFDQPRVLAQYFEMIRGYAEDYNSPIEQIKRMAGNHGVLRWFASKIERFPGFLVATLCTLFTLGTAWLDWFVGHDIGLLFFYLPPIIIMSLRFGPWLGSVYAIFTSCAWLTADIYSLPPDVVIGVSLWNGLMRFANFIFVATVTGSLNATIQQRETLINELQTALAQSRRR